MIPTVAVITIVVLAIFSLFLFAASCGDLSERLNKLAESQSLLSQSQYELATVVKEMIPAVDNLVSEREELRAEIQRLSKAVRHQAVTGLKQQLILLCSGDSSAARKRFELERAADPGKEDEWYFKQAISSLTLRPKPTSPE